jgi:hypothetical protein
MLTIQKSKIFMFGLAAVMGLLIASQTVLATLTEYSTRASWEAAVGAWITESFDASPIGEILDGASLNTGLLTLSQNAQGSTGDLNIADGGAFGNINGTPFVDGFTGGAPGAIVTIDFNGQTANAFGADWVSPGSGAGIKFAINNDEASLLPLGSGSGFFGVVSDLPFNSVAILRDGTSGIFAEVWSGDDFSFSVVPEPATGLACWFGLLAFMLRRRS